MELDEDTYFDKKDLSDELKESTKEKFEKLLNEAYVDVHQAIYSFQNKITPFKYSKLKKLDDFFKLKKTSDGIAKRLRNINEAEELLNAGKSLEQSVYKIVSRHYINFSKFRNALDKYDPDFILNIEENREKLYN